jgi:hypothetical protein
MDSVGGMGNLLRHNRVKAMHLDEASAFPKKAERLRVVRRRVHVEIKAGIV